MTVLVPIALASALSTAPQDDTDGVYVQERLGEVVPHDIALTDQRGHSTTLGEQLQDGRPVVLVLAYYRCPMLCGLVIQGLARTIRELDGALADEYHLVTVSFDPRDGPADAERARATALETAGLPTGGSEWPFMSTEPAEARRLADALGFGYAYDESTEQYAHPAVLFVLAPDGTISRYLHGLEQSPLDLRFALVEAGRGRVGTFAEQAILTCYRYDPTARRYGFWVRGFMRVAGTLILLVLGAAFVVLVARDVRRTRAARRTEEA